MAAYASVSRVVGLLALAGAPVAISYQLPRFAPTRTRQPSMCAPMAPPDELVRVLPADCPSCEADYLVRSKEAELEEQQRLSELRLANLSGFSYEVWEYAQRMNDTQRQEVALDPDVELRNFIINSCTPPTPLMETVYNATMTRVPYEMACASAVPSKRCSCARSSASRGRRRPSTLARSRLRLGHPRGAAREAGYVPRD